MFAVRRTVTVAGAHRASNLRHRVDARSILDVFFLQLSLGSNSPVIVASCIHMIAALSPAGGAERDGIVGTGPSPWLLSCRARRPFPKPVEMAFKLIEQEEKGFPFLFPSHPAEHCSLRRRHNSTHRKVRPSVWLTIRASPMPAPVANSPALSGLEAEACW